MKNAFFLFAAITSAAVLAWAGGSPQTGTLISETSVSCGSHTKGKNKSYEIDCQQYLIRSGATDYLVRQQKPSDTGIIPINTPVEFTLDKNKIKFKANGHSYEYLVVSEGPAGARP